MIKRSELFKCWGRKFGKQKFVKSFKSVVEHCGNGVRHKIKKVEGWSVKKKMVVAGVMGILTVAAAAMAITPTEAEKALSLKGLKVVSVKETVIKGLSEAYVTAGNQKGLILIDNSGKYVIQGQIIDVKTQQPVVKHVKEFPPRKVFAGVDIKKIPIEHAITIGDPKSENSVYVFTDPDCPYCRSLHPTLKKLKELMPDAAIHIMVMPIPSLHPQAYDKARYLLSHKDDMKALDAAFAGKPIPKAKPGEGKAAVDAIMKFASEAGIQGTPTVLGPDGQILAGPRDVESLKAAISAKKKKK